MSEHIAPASGGTKTITLSLSSELSVDPEEPALVLGLGEVSVRIECTHPYVWAHLGELANTLCVLAHRNHVETLTLRDVAAAIEDHQVARDAERRERS